MSNADPIRGAVVSLSPDDQYRIYNTVIMRLGATWPSTPPFDAETPRGIAAARLRELADATTTAADLIAGTIAGAVTVTQAIREFAAAALADLNRYLADERATLKAQLAGDSEFPGMTSEESANETRTLIADIEAEVRAVRLLA